MIRGFDTDAHQALLEQINGRKRRLSKISSLLYHYAINADESGMWDTSLAHLQGAMDLTRNQVRDILRRLQDAGFLEHRVARKLSGAEIESGLADLRTVVHIRIVDSGKLFPAIGEGAGRRGKPRKK